MNLTSLFAALFPSIFDAAAAKIIHQVAGTKRGDDILAKNGQAIEAIKTVAAPYIAQQVHIRIGGIPQ